MENDLQSKEAKSFFKQWLEKLQQESWQLELIISGFALFGIWSSKSLIIDFQYWSSTISNDFFMIPLYWVLKYGWRIFFINLLIHVILRALWIGAIGLRYVSGEIEFEDLGYAPLFKNYLEKKVGDYDDFIERLEKICSVLFSYTFLLFLLFVSLVIYIVAFALPFEIYSWLKIESESNILLILGFAYGIFYFLMGIIVFIDFITLGSLKKINDPLWFKIYNPIYRFFSTITLSFLYRPLLYNFIDSKYTRRLFWFSFPYILIIFISDKSFSSHQFSFFPSTYHTLQDGSAVGDYWYEDKYLAITSKMNEEERKKQSYLFEVRLESFYVNKDFQWVFFRFYDRDHDYFEKKGWNADIYKKGTFFSLFGNKGIKKDSIKTDSLEQFKLQMKLLTESYREIRDRKKLEKDSLVIVALKNEIDSLKKKRTHFNTQLKEWENDYDQRKRNKNLEYLKSLVTLSLDNKEKELECFYHNYGEKLVPGIMCFYNVSDLEKGLHNVKVERIMYQTSNKDNKEIYNLPILKMN
jgi:hypothetical protein